MMTAPSSPARQLAENDGGLPGAFGGQDPHRQFLEQADPIDCASGAGAFGEALAVVLARLRAGEVHRAGADGRVVEDAGAGQAAAHGQLAVKFMPFIAQARDAKLDAELGHGCASIRPR